MSDHYEPLSDLEEVINSEIKYVIRIQNYMCLLTGSYKPIHSFNREWHFREFECS